MIKNAFLYKLPLILLLLVLSLFSCNQQVVEKVINQQPVVQEIQALMEAIGKLVETNNLLSNS